MNDTDKRAIEEIPADAVIQALKCCASEEDNCHRCPFMGVGGISDICITAMSRAALDLIYRKQSEVIDEFAERLKEAPIKCGLPLLGLSTKEEIDEYFDGIMLQVRDAIDSIAKEMKGGE